MARAATTTDAFNAVAEPRRRQILDLLAQGERPVGDFVRLLGLAQPQVSKHLRVLREVGLVRVREEGRQRVYRLNAEPLKPIHDWLATYERRWNARFDRMDDVLEDLKSEDLKSEDRKSEDRKSEDRKSEDLKSEDLEAKEIDE
jgi:DNA-binding transcriptional ArsR family regulator